MTEKQKIFAVYLLNKLGIVDEQFVNKYIVYHEKLYGKYYFKTYQIGWKTIRELNYTASECIEALLDEVELKKSTNKIFEKDLNENNCLATDISNYSFCPAAYSISKSFVIDKPVGFEKTNIGKILHEELRLDKKIDFLKSSKKDEISDVYSNELIKEIINSRLIFCGHGEKTDWNSCRDDTGNCVGIPDYIFVDKNNQYFVVEEKFQQHSDYRRIEKSTDRKWDYYTYLYGINYEPFDKELEWDNQRFSNAYNWSQKEPFFFINHILQTVSYIINIKRFYISKIGNLNNFEIKYGYLIYWYYDIEKGKPYIHRVAIKKISKDKFFTSQYHKYLTQLKEFVERRFQPFDIQELNPNKCAACVVSKYCMHKTGRFDRIEFPYKKADIKVFPVIFPEKLKKNI